MNKERQLETSNNLSAEEIVTVNMRFKIAKLKNRCFIKITETEYSDLSDWQWKMARIFRRPLHLLLNKVRRVF